MYELIYSIGKKLPGKVISVGVTGIIHMHCIHYLFF